MMLRVYLLGCEMLRKISDYEVGNLASVMDGSSVSTLMSHRNNNSKNHHRQAFWVSCTASLITTA